MRRYFEVDLLPLAELNPKYTVDTLFKKFQSDFLANVKSWEKEMKQQPDGLIVLKKNKNKFQAVITNYTSGLSDKIINVLEFTLHMADLVVPSNSNEYIINYCFM